MTKPFVRYFKVGKYKVTVIAEGPFGRGTIGGITMQWEPKVPRFMGKKLFEEYEIKRNAAFASLAKELSGPMAVVGGDGKITGIEGDD